MLFTILAVLLLIGISSEPAVGLSGEDMNLGSITLYEGDDFAGYNFLMPIFRAKTCYNLDCYNNRVSSAIWKLPPDGENEDAHIYLYDLLDCEGSSESFDIRNTDRVASLSGELANKVSSIMVMRTSGTPVPDAVRNCSGAALVNSRDQPVY